MPRGKGKGPGRPRKPGRPKGSKNKKLKVTKESATGENLRFKDTKTNRSMSKSEAIKAVKNGTYSGYNVKKRNGKEYIASNPDNSRTNNLD